MLMTSLSYEMKGANVAVKKTAKKTTKKVAKKPAKKAAKKPPRRRQEEVGTSSSRAGRERAARFSLARSSSRAVTSTDRRWRRPLSRHADRPGEERNGSSYSSSPQQIQTHTKERLSTE